MFDPNVNGEIIPVLIEVKSSKILDGEIGLFAARKLKKGTIIAEAIKLGEKFIPWSFFASVDDVTKEKIGNYCLDTEEGFYAPPDFNYLSTPWNMNHSCDYNVGFDDVGNFITIRDVDGGEELFWDYGMGRSNPNFVLNCKCGSEKCRKIITGNDWKNLDYVNINKEYFLRELLAKTNINLNK
jgi:hypothetical protein